ncbi:hypothetical protein U9M48_006301 [Paspalum notatum var. saurae]|uniref:Uncharacterized protein n=1 Tax=Paspalum notatum var. saurae TaxID=547442 RepID=A0AAQ3PZI7_PASNO
MGPWNLLHELMHDCSREVCLLSGLRVRLGVTTGRPHKNVVPTNVTEAVPHRRNGAGSAAAPHCTVCCTPQTNVYYFTAVPPAARLLLSPGPFVLKPSCAFPLDRETTATVFISGQPIQSFNPCVSCIDNDFYPDAKLLSPETQARQHMNHLEFPTPVSVVSRPPLDSSISRVCEKLMVNSFAGLRPRLVLQLSDFEGH